MSKLEEVNEVLKGAFNEPGLEDEAEQDTEPADPFTEPGAGEEEDRAGIEEFGEEEEAQSVKAIADKLGTSPKALYDSIRVPLEDGEMVSLGELKDMAKASASERLQYAESNAELIGQRRNLALIAEHITPEMAQEMDATLQAHFAREERLLKAALPTWRDEQVAEADKRKIAALAGRFGMTRAELDAQLTDHRMIALLRYAALTGGASARPEKAAPRAPRTPDIQRKARAPDATKLDKLGAITALITH